MEKKQDPRLFKEFAGLRNDVDPERFTPADLVAAVNVDIDKSGRLARRAGRVRVLNAAVHSLWAEDDLALFVTGTTLKRLQANYSVQTLMQGLTAAARMSYMEVNGRVYFSNAFQTGVFENGSVRSWGLPVPPMVDVAVTGGYMPAGEYQFTTTYFRTDGQESGAGLALTVTVPENSGLVFTLPVPTDSTIIAKGIYLSTPNGDELYLAMTVPVSATMATYTNDATELMAPLMTQFLSAPPAGQLVRYFKGRMFVAVDDLMYYSEPFAYELFDARNYIQFDGRITLMAELEEKDAEGSGGFFVGTDKSCGILAGSGPESFQYVPKQRGGAVLGALDYVDGSLFDDGGASARLLPMWLTTEGICVGVSGMGIRNLTRTKYGFNVAGEGAALFKPGLNQFIVTNNL